MTRRFDLSQAVKMYHTIITQRKVTRSACFKQADTDIPDGSLDHSAYMHKAPWVMAHMRPRTSRLQRSLFTSETDMLAGNGELWKQLISPAVNRKRGDPEVVHLAVPGHRRQSKHDGEVTARNCQKRSAVCRMCPGNMSNGLLLAAAVKNVHQQIEGKHLYQAAIRGGAIYLHSKKGNTVNIKHHGNNRCIQH